MCLDSQNIKTTCPAKKFDDKWFGPFEVVEKVGASAYRLKLPRTWRKVHPVFNECLLKPAVEPQFPSQHKPPPPPPVIIDEEEEYEVEDILDSKYAGRGIRYFVKWVGYGPEHNSWLSRTQLANSLDLIEQFHRLYPNKPHKINSALLN